MKRFQIIIILLIILFPVFISAEDSNKSYTGWGIGIMAGDPTGLSVKYNNFPVMGFSWALDNHFQFQCDYWAYNDTFKKSAFLYYIGVGGKIGMFYKDDKPKTSDNEEKDMNIGIRIPLGLQYFFNENIEAFGEIAPGLNIYPATDFGIDFAIGVRYNFK